MIFMSLLSRIEKKARESIGMWPMTGPYFLPIQARIQLSVQCAFTQCASCARSPGRGINIIIAISSPHSAKITRTVTSLSFISTSIAIDVGAVDFAWYQFFFLFKQFFFYIVLVYIYREHWLFPRESPATLDTERVLHKCVFSAFPPSHFARYIFIRRMPRRGLVCHRERGTTSCLRLLRHPRAFRIHLLCYEDFVKPLLPRESRPLSSLHAQTIRGFFSPRAAFLMVRNDIHWNELFSRCSVCLNLNFCRP